MVFEKLLKPNPDYCRQSVPVNKMIRLGFTGYLLVMCLSPLTDKLINSGLKYCIITSCSGFVCF